MKEPKKELKRPFGAGIVTNRAVPYRQMSGVKRGKVLLFDVTVWINCDTRLPDEEELSRMQLLVIHRSGVSTEQFNEWRAWADSRQIPMLIADSASALSQAFDAAFTIDTPAEKTTPQTSVSSQAQHIISSSNVLSQLQQVNMELESALVQAQNKEQRLNDESLKILEEAEQAIHEKEKLEVQLELLRASQSTNAQAAAAIEQAVAKAREEEKERAASDLREANKELAKRAEDVHSAQVALSKMTKMTGDAKNVADYMQKLCPEAYHKTYRHVLRTWLHLYTIVGDFQTGSDKDQAVVQWLCKHLEKGLREPAIRADLLLALETQRSSYDQYLQLVKSGKATSSDEEFTNLYVNQTAATIILPTGEKTTGERRD